MGFDLMPIIMTSINKDGAGAGRMAEMHMHQLYVRHRCDERVIWSCALSPSW